MPQYLHGKTNVRGEAVENMVDRSAVNDTIDSLGEPVRVDHMRNTIYLERTEMGNGWDHTHTLIRNLSTGGTTCPTVRPTCNFSKER